MWADAREKLENVAVQKLLGGSATQTPRASLLGSSLPEAGARDPGHLPDSVLPAASDGLCFRTAYYLPPLPLRTLLREGSDLLGPHPCT